MIYASFWKRAVAFIIDVVIIYMVVFAEGFICALVLHKESAQAFAILIAIAFYLAYYVWLESSSWQATLGKKIFGLKVTDENGRRISFMRSLVRNLGMTLSSMILYIGYLMCLWTEQSQCLHDKIAGCLVLEGEYPRMTTQELDNWTPPELDLSETESKTATHATGREDTSGADAPSKVGTMDVIE